MLNSSRDSSWAPKSYIQRRPLHEQPATVDLDDDVFTLLYYADAMLGMPRRFL
jgi:hypothetical protein